jgi:hypothetical protein
MERPVAAIFNVEAEFGIIFVGNPLFDEHMLLLE